jgi:hypothetical protein
MRAPGRGGGEKPGDGFEGSFLGRPALPESEVRGGAVEDGCGLRLREDSPEKAPIRGLPPAAGIREIHHVVAENHRGRQDDGLLRRLAQDVNGNRR